MSLQLRRTVIADDTLMTNTVARHEQSNDLVSIVYVFTLSQSISFCKHEPLQTVIVSWYPWQRIGRNHQAQCIHYATKRLLLNG